MKYVILDIETTGTDPTKDQILEIAALKSWDWESQFTQVVYWDRISGHPIAMQMNAALMTKVCDPEQSVDIATAIERLKKWLCQNLIWEKGKEPKFNLAGKNVGTFDLQFFRQVMPINDWFRGRVIDPTVFYARLDDEKLPDTTQCLERARLAGKIQTKHDALGDCYIVKLLLDYAHKYLRSPIAVNDPKWDNLYPTLEAFYYRKS